MADNESSMTVQFMRDLNKEVGDLKDFMQSEVRALSVTAERSAVTQEHNSDQIRNMDRTLRGNGESVLTRLTALENTVAQNAKAAIKARKATDDKIDAIGNRYFPCLSHWGHIPLPPFCY